MQLPIFNLERDILTYYQNLVSNKQYIDRLKQLSNEQVEVEAEYVKNNGNSCLLSQVYLDNLNTVKPPVGNTLIKNDINSYVINNFDNPNIFELVKCIAEAISLKPDYEDSPGRQLRLRHFLGQLRLNSHGSFDSTDLSFFNLKFNLDPAVINHEFFVADNFINSLRIYIPNFSYVYSSFSCTAPLVDNNNVVTWCDRQSLDRFLIVENVPGPTLTQFLLTSATLAPENFLGIFFSTIIQVCYALFSVNDLENMNKTTTYTFTHNNLTSNNIILRNNNNNNNVFVIPYRVKLYHLVQFVKATNVATIINYDNSSLKINNKIYTNFNNITKGLDPEQIHPFYDIFTLLISSYLFLPNIAKPYVIRLIQFFDNNINSNNITNLFQLGLELPFLPPRPNLTIDAFMEHLYNTIGRDLVFVGDYPKALVPFCGYRKDCKNVESLAEQFSFNLALLPPDPFDFYDFVNTNIPQKVVIKGRTELQLIPQVPNDDKHHIIIQYANERYLKPGVEKLYSVYANHYGRFLNLYNKLGLTMPSLQKVHQYNLTDKAMQTSYVNYLYDIANFIEEVDTLILLRQVLIFFRDNYSNYININMLNFDNLNEADTNIVFRLQSIKNDLSYLHNAIRITPMEPRYQEYRNDLINFYNQVKAFTSFNLQ